MIPVIQTILADPEQKEGSPRGNCMRACLASILEIGIDDIPSFEQEPDETWKGTFIEFLHSQGLTYNGLIQNPTQEELNSYPGLDGYYMVGGESPRPWVKCGHGVVYYKGQPCHDPHPSGEFLKKVWFIYKIERIESE